MLKRLLLLIILSVSPVFGTTRYVDIAAGSDSNTCVQSETVGTAKATLLAGFACMSAGDRLEIRAGTYDESGTGSTAKNIPNGTSWANATTITNYSGEAVTYRPAWTEGGSTSLLFKNAGGSRYIIVSNITIDGTRQAAGSNPGISFQNNAGTTQFIRISNVTILNAKGDGVAGEGEDIEILSCTIHTNGTNNLNHGIYATGDGWTIANSSMYSNTGLGIQLFDANAGGSSDNHVVYGNLIYSNVDGGGVAIDGDNNKVYNNFIYDNTGDGIVVGYLPGSSGNLIYNNTLDGNTSDGISVGVNGPAVSNILRNNIASNNGRYGIINDDEGTSSDPDLTTIENNLTYNNTSGAIIDNGTNTVSSGNVAGDPSFVNRAAKNFHINSGSPAENAGLNLTSTFTDDYDGQARPSGGSWDIGADEIIAADPSPPAPAVCNASVAVDAFSNGNGTASTLTISHVTGSGSNRFMLVAVWLREGATSTVSGVTYGGVALTSVAARTCAAGDASRCVEFWRLINPAAGTANVVITQTGAGSNGIAGVVGTYTGVHQTTPLGTVGTHNATAATSSINISSAASEIVFDAQHVNISGSSGLTVGADQTQRYNAAVQDMIEGSSTEPGAATTTMSWTWTGANYQSHQAVAIKNATLSCGTPGALMMMGVGP